VIPAPDEYAYAPEDVGTLDRVADTESAVGQELRPESAAVDERTEQSLTSELLKVAARFAELRCAAEDVADPERAPEQVVEANATRGEVAAQFARCDLDAGAMHLVDDLALDQRQVAAYAIVAPVAGAAGVAVAEEADSATHGDPAE
jgi:hypothetical protein